MNFGSAVVAVASLIAAAPAFALPLHYDEIVDGDLADDIMESQFYHLGLGWNSVSGTLRLAIETGPYVTGSDFDHIGLIVPARTEVRSIGFSIYATDDGTAQFYGVGPYLSSYPTPSVTYPTWQVPNGAEVILPAENESLFEGLLPFPYTDEPIYGVVMPMSHGNYVLGTGTMGGNGSEGEYRVAAYRFDIQVAPVPTAATGILLLTGVTCLTVAGRRRRRS